MSLLLTYINFFISTQCETSVHAYTLERKPLPSAYHLKTIIFCVDAILI